MPAAMNARAASSTAIASPAKVSFDSPSSIAETFGHVAVDFATDPGD